MSRGARALALLALLPLAAAARSVDERLEPGVPLFLRGEVGRAADFWALERQLGEDPQLDAVLADAYSMIGRRALLAGDYALAEASFSSAAAVARPGSDFARLARLAREAAAGRAKPGKKDFDDSLESDRLFTRLLLSQAPKREEAPKPKREPSALKRKSEAQAAANGGSPSQPHQAAAGADPKDLEEGLRLYYRGDVAGARAVLEKAAAAAPGDAKARKSLKLVADALKREAGRKRYEEGLRLYYSGDAAGAEAALAEVVTLDPSNAKARETLERLRTRRRSGAN